MARTIDLSEAFDLHRLALRDALAHGDRDLGVHGARRAIKALRALLRLVRPSGSDDPRRFQVRALDAELKALADALATARDLRVAAATALSLVDEVDDEAARAALTRLAAEWLGEAARRETASDHLGAEQARRSEAAIAEHLAALPLSASRGDVARAVAGVYAKARRLLRTGLRADDPDVLHEARRNLVRLQIHVQALGPALGGRMRKLGRQAGRLRQVLGEHHDLAELERRLDGSGVGSRLLGRLVHHVEARAEALAETAALQGGKALRRRPKAVRRKLKRA
ncbi:hypothetical protein GCM10007036_44310 [Alsobacter metallidurans]|uniref:CHAD domain-containing protein n=1 Tax=Alsobacter metallidurans TaxID=340221 RepID=A0A917MJZ6_9HYPH|nr:CHAD domain-containing protein [Alsobacter metallidurans]GGH32443.1 hypothetical protein GCM10007036_44310 [Alsobacter metallidurans]